MGQHVPLTFRQGLYLLLSVLFVTLSTVHCEDCFNVSVADSSSENYVLSSDETGDAGFLTDVSTLVEMFMDSVTPKFVFNGTLDMGFLTIENGEIAMTGSENIINSIGKVQNAPAFLVCISVAVIFICLVPPVAFIFCCCRVCNNCGGKMVQEKKGSDRLERYCCGGFLLLCSAFILICATSIFLVNSETNGLYNKLVNQKENVFGDAELYVSNTGAEVNYLMDDSVDCVKSSIESLLNDSITSMNGVVVSLINAVIDKAVVVSDDVTALYTLISSINTTASQLVSDIGEITNELDDIKTDLQDKVAGCVDSNAECAAINGSAEKLEAEFEFNDIPTDEIDDALTEVDATYDKDYASLLSSARSNLTSEISEQTDSIKNEIDDYLTEFDNLELDSFNISEYVPISDIKQTLNQYLDDIEDMKDSIINFKSYALYGLASIVLLFPLLFLCGLLLGLCGYNKGAEPYERSAISNCGGICLMSGAGIFLIFSSLLMTLTLLLFVAGTFSNMACNIVENPGDVSQVISIVLKNSTYSNFAEGFGQCEDNVGAYSAFSLSEYVDIDTEMDDIKTSIKDQIDAFTWSGDIDSDTVISEDDLDILEDLKAETTLNIDNSTLLQVNFTTEVDLSEFITTLENFTVVDVTVYVERLKTVQDNLTDLNTQKDTLLGLLSDLSDTFAQFQDDVTTLLAELTDIPSSANDTIQTELETTRTSLKGELDTLSSALLDAVHSDVGQCRPLYNIYQTSVALICDDVINTLNAVTFALGASLIIGLICVFLAVHLAKHLRRMTHKYVKKGGGEDIDMQSFPPRGEEFNPNHPHQMTPLGGGAIGESQLNLIEEQHSTPAAFNNRMYAQPQPGYPNNDDPVRNSYMAPPPYGGYKYRSGAADEQFFGQL